MSALSRWASVGALLLWVGCAEPPQLSEVGLDVAPLCPDASRDCLNTGVETHELAGVRVHHKYVANSPTVAVQLWFDATDHDGLTYWSDKLALELLEHHGPAVEARIPWEQQLQAIGARVELLRTADADAVSLNVVAPQWRAGWALLAEALAQPQVDAYYLTHWARATRQQFDSESDDPRVAGSTRAWSRIAQGTRLDRGRAWRDALGSVTPNDLRAAWSRLKVKQRLRVVVVGDVRYEEIAPLLEEALGGFAASAVGSPTASARVPEPQAAPMPTPGTEILRYPDAPTWHLATYVRGPRSDDPSLGAFWLAMLVLDARLFDQLRLEHNLAYTAGAAIVTYRQTLGWLGVSTRDPAQAVEVVRDLVSGLRASAPSPAELDAARATLTTTLLRDSATAEGLATTLGTWEVNVGDRRAADALLARILLIEGDEVQRAASMYLRAAATVASGPDAPSPREPGAAPVAPLTTALLGTMLPP